MSIDTNKVINVLNYNMNPVAIKTHIKEYLCSPAEDNDHPSINPLSFSEVESLNSNSNAFSIGMLRFSPDVEEEIYDVLRIVEWKKILSNEDIEEIILHPSVSGLTKLVEIKNTSLFERVRGIYFYLKNTDQYDISTRVEKIINARYKELVNKQVKSNILLSTKDTTTNIPNEEVIELKEQNKNMQTQMENMQKMMEQMMALQAGNVVAQVETPIAKAEVKPKTTPTKTVNKPSAKTSQSTK